MELVAAAGAASTEPLGESECLSFWTMLSCLLIFRLSAAMLAPIMDCDETFNYLEPVHYITRGSGMQTWEYSPQFALRSYALVEAYAVPVWIAQGLLGMDKVRTFFFLRSFLGALSAVCEVVFCRAVMCRTGQRTGLLTFCFMTFASGMWHASVATLPSTLCMYAVLVGFAAYLRGRVGVGLWCGSMAVLLGMPPAAPLFVPMGLMALRPSSLGLLGVIKVATQAVVAFVVLPSCVDCWYYGTSRPVWTMGNHLLYNVFSVGGGGAGADLYGTEPWTFYAKNLILNFNLVAVLACMSGTMLLLAHVARWRVPPQPPPSATDPGHQPGRERGSGMAPMELLFVVILPFSWTLWMFTSLSHKEERFLTMLYPLLCFAAALAADLALAMFESIVGLLCCQARRPSPITRTLTNLIALSLVLGTSALSVSRSAALYYHFRAPLRLYEKLYYDVVAAETPPAGGVCLGKEWYRFPSSFFLPDVPGEDGLRSMPLLWLNSSFDGQLPRPFDPGPHGTSRLPPHMNDRNLREASRYSQEGDCSFLVDLHLFSQQEPPPDPGIWSVAWCEAFLDTEASPFPWRSFWLPFGISDKRNSFGKYCIWRRAASGGETTSR